MDMQKAFEVSMSNSKNFKEAYEIVSRNSEGNIWIVGGFVFRSIAEKLYSTEKHVRTDFDFIIEKPPRRIVWPKDWGIDKTGFGNPRLKKDKIIIDYMSLSSTFNDSVGVRRDCDISIEGYLVGVPLTIQSIAYDIRERKLMGEIRINAILNKTVAVNDFEEAMRCATKKRMSLQELVNKKADSLGFTPFY